MLDGGGMTEWFSTSYSRKDIREMESTIFKTPDSIELETLLHEGKKVSK